MGPQQFLAPVEDAAESRLGVIKAPPHLDILRALASKQERDETRLSAGYGGPPKFPGSPPGGQGRRSLGQTVYRVGENHQPVSEMGSPGIGRVTDIGEGDFRMSSEECPVTAGLIP